MNARYQVDSLVTNPDMKRYLELLFDPTDLIGFKGPQVWLPPTAEPQADSEFAILNPVKHHRDAKMETIATYRNILIEFDGMDLDRQLALVKKLNMPYTTCTYSGGSSYHFVISMTEPFESLTGYRDYTNLIHAVVKKADVKCKNANRLTRLAGANRADRFGELQELVEAKERVTLGHLEYWLSIENARTTNEYRLSKLSIIRDPLANSDDPTDTELSDRVKQIVETGETFGKSRHDALMEVILNARGCGYDEIQAHELGYQAALALGIADRSDLEGLMQWAYGSAGVGR